jgi:hypothetical protein
MTDEELNIISDLLDSWKEFNWQPEWFETKKIDTELYSRILRFQKSHHLNATGVIDYKTFEKLYTVESFTILYSSSGELYSSNTISIIGF